MACGDDAARLEVVSILLGMRHFGAAYVQLVASHVRPPATRKPVLAPLDRLRAGASHRDRQLFVQRNLPQRRLPFNEPGYRRNPYAAVAWGCEVRCR